VVKCNPYYSLEGPDGWIKCGESGNLEKNVPTCTKKDKAPEVTTPVSIEPESQSRYGEKVSDKVCAKGRDPSPRDDAHRFASRKTFTLTKSLRGVTLLHTTGSIKCGPSHNVSCKNDPWGSYERKNGKTYRNIVLVGEDKRILEATDAAVGINGGRADEKEMYFAGPLGAGKYEVWYREDFQESNHTDNTGESCFSVFETN